MKKFCLQLAFCVCVLCILSSCDREGELRGRFERIKKMGEVDPKMAQKMLDSLNVGDFNWSEYWRMKYQLLKIRIDDKNYRPVTSDVQVKEVVDYFENHGNNLDRQEAFYYAGSTYRDLKDHPLSLHYYLEAMEACEGEEPYDTMLLRSTYSNLCYQYFMVQDYENTAKMSRKEYSLSKEIGMVDALSAMQLGAALARINKNEEAERMYVEAYNLLDQTDSVYRRDVVSTLLGHFSCYKMKEYADKCFELAQREWDFSALEPTDYTGLAKYYLLSGMPDSAIYYYKARCDKNMELLHQYESNKNLLRIYYGLGNMKEAARYGMLFAQCSDSLDLGERQRLAATVNNAFQYQHEKMEEEALIRKEESHRRMMRLTFGVMVGLVVSFLIIFLYQKNRNLARQNTMLNKLKTAEEEIEKMNGRIREVSGQLEEKQRVVTDLKEKIGILEEERIANERILEEERIANERILKERTERIQKMQQLIRQGGLAEKAEQAVKNIYDTQQEKRRLGKKDWAKFYAAMDAMYPPFKDCLMEISKRMKPEKMKVAYLMLAGLPGPQIEDLMETPRSTVWRWIGELDWIWEQS